RVEVRIRMNKAGATTKIFDWLQGHKNDIEKALSGYKVSWEPEAERKACRVALRWDIDLKDESTHEKIIEQMVERTQKFHKVIFPYIEEGLAHHQL
ncbi:MAG: hypothetical protein CMK92_05420, partial [Pseudomonas sp.]|nr:hypothetical protein [Pseudomonas sp.]